MKLLIMPYDTYEVGAFRRMANMAKCLVQKGHEVTLTAASPKNRGPGIIRSEVDGIQVFEYGVPIAGNPAENSIRIYREIKDLISIVAKERYDVVQIHGVASLQMGTTAIYSMLSTSSPLVVAWDDLWGKEGMGRVSFGTHMWMLYTLFEQQITSHADHVLVPSEGLRRRALSLGIPESRVSKMYVGTDVERIKPMDKVRARARTGIGDRYTLLYLGGAYDNFETRIFLLRALNELKHMIPSVKLIMTRPYHRDAGGLGERAEELGVSENLVDAGAVPREELPYLLGSADVMTLPLLDNGVDRMRYPGRFADMLASGRPALVSDVGDLASIVNEGRCGLVFKAGDPHDMAEKALQLWENQSKSEKMGLNARKLAEEQFDWKRLTDRLEDMYKLVVAGARSRER